MKKIKLLIPVLALSSLSICSLPMISMVGCGNPDKPEPIPPEPSTQPFETCDWSYINQKATALENDEISQEEFCNSFTINSKIPTSMDEFIGAERRVQLEHQDIDGDNDPQDYISGNEVAQTVRVIGTSADDAETYQVNMLEGNKKASLTFEFKNLISDANGYSLASIWQDTPTIDGSNHDYLNSTIRKNISGNGGGTLAWYGTTLNGSTLTGDTIKANASTHPDYYNKSVYEMLPDDLKNILKQPQNRVVNKTTSGWGSTWPSSSYETQITDKLFLLTTHEYNEFNFIPYTNYCEQTMKSYVFYKDAVQTSDPIRIKQQIKGSDGALTSVFEIEDALYTGAQCLCDAGFNSSNGGNNYWLSSPYTNDNVQGWNVYDNGGVTQTVSAVCSIATGISPAFCI